MRNDATAMIVMCMKVPPTSSKNFSLIFKCVRYLSIQRNGISL